MLAPWIQAVAAETTASASDIAAGGAWSSVGTYQEEFNSMPTSWGRSSA